MPFFLNWYTISYIEIQIYILDLKLGPKRVRKTFRKKVRAGRKGYRSLNHPPPPSSKYTDGILIYIKIEADLSDHSLSHACIPGDIEEQWLN